MNLKNSLQRDSVALHLQGRTKEEVIDELLAVAQRSGKVKDLAAARKSVLEREGRMSTGLKYGIAIPHGKTETVRDLVAVIGISDTGVDFEALDGEDCRIFVLTLSPADRTGPHLQFLAEVSLFFENEAKRKAVLAAQSPEEVVALLS